MLYRGRSPIEPQESSVGGFESYSEVNESPNYSLMAIEPLDHWSIQTVEGLSRHATRPSSFSPMGE
ncbi:hypothetical protein RND71_017234 [Anisodus tanguticus]|uniref:Uncharacterized protein n=1 Tax=Anisodus tanguticus TaxID=243964 RepID=A0AAE1S1W1_9SOLA|nr:hypothetical protein RND71_017234 [Anisodus tanguticus]